MNGINTEYFLAIVEEGTLTRAALRLYVSQSSLSQYLKRLERSLGVELFDHNVSPLRLTYAGQRFYEHVKQQTKMEENLRREFQDMQNEISGRLRLGIPTWRGACLLPEVYPQLHKKYPGIRLELVECSSQKMEQVLMNDQIDLAVMNLPHSLDYSRFSSAPIYEERILVCMPQDDERVQAVLKNCRYSRGYPVVPFSLLAEMPLLITRPGMNLTVEVNHLLGKNRVEPKVLLETSNLTTAINLAAQGMGYAFVPEGGAKVCMRPGKVVYFAVDAPGHAWTLAAVYRKDVYLSRLARIFIDEMYEAFKGMRELSEENENGPQQ